jgi:hypothetical protein
MLVVLACATNATRRERSSIAAPPGSVAGGELRAFWVDAFGDGFTQAQIDQLVADVRPRT